MCKEVYIKEIMDEIELVNNTEGLTSQQVKALQSQWGKNVLEKNMYQYGNELANC